MQSSSFPAVLLTTSSRQPRRPLQVDNFRLSHPLHHHNSQQPSRRPGAEATQDPRRQQNSTVLLPFCTIDRRATGLQFRLHLSSQRLSMFIFQPKWLLVNAFLVLLVWKAPYYHYILGPGQMEFVPESFLETAPWIFDGTAEIPVPVDTCFAIISDVALVNIMYPIITDAVYLEPIETLGRRTVTVKLFVSNVVEEKFDVFDNEGDVQTYSFYFTSASVPLLWATTGREQYTCEKLSDTTSMFRVKAAFQPNFIMKLLFFIFVPIFRGTFQGAAENLRQHILASQS